MVSHWAFDKKGKQIKDTFVIITFDNGNVVERYKGKDGNLYKVNGQVIEAFGQDVPQMVLDACNFNDTNLQSQMDAPFLLASSAGEVARFLNKIVKLDRIDTYLAAIESKKRKTKAELDNTKQNLEKVEKELGGYSYLELAGKVLARLEKLEAKLMEAKAISNSLASCIATYDDAVGVHSKTDFAIRARVLVEELEGLVAEHRLADEKAEDISDKLDAYDAFKESIKATEIIPVATVLVARLEKTMSKHAEAIAALSNIADSVRVYDLGKSTIEAFENEHKLYKDQLPDVCPTCGKPIEEDV